jgi:inosose dehydratase
VTRIASAPASFGVFSATVRRPGLPDGAGLAKIIAEAGYAGTELGPPSYFGEGGGIAELLGEHGLALAGALVPMRFSRRDAHEEDDELLDRTLATLELAAGGGALPVVLLADAVIEPDRIEYAGAIEERRESWLPEPRFATLLDAVHRAAERCSQRGFTAALLPHAGSYVETPREVARVAEAIDPALLGLCFDSAQSVLGGGDPLQLLLEYGELVRHVHLADLDLARLSAVRESGGSLMSVWESRVFTRLGTGGAQVAECVAELQRRSYDGWMVARQDRLPAADEPFAVAVDDAGANRAWLAERGL